ncbi:MAG: MBL fold metallo-hydrolase [Armatimonadia bacterium]
MMSIMAPNQLEFNCWPVGHGLFTSCDVHADKDHFRMVYDCGSKSDVTKSIGDLVGRSAHGVDLLVVSHFDADHVSGIPELADRCGIRMAWIPYMSPEMRALALLRSAASGEPLPPDDVLALMIRPRAELERRNVQVFELGGPPEDGAEGTRRRPPANEPPEDGRPPKRGREQEPYLPSSDTLEVTDPRPWPEAMSGSTEFAAYSSSMVLRIPQRNDERVLDLFTWTRKEFKKGRSIDDIINNVLSKLSRGGALALTALWDASANELTTDGVIQLLRRLHSGDASDLKKIYEAAMGANQGSLFLLAQPYWTHRFEMGALSRHRPHHSICFRVWTEYYRTPVVPNAPAGPDCLLWTGDAPTATLNKLVRDAGSPLRSKLGHTDIWQVPHHGSKGSCSCSFCSLLPTFATRYASCPAEGQGLHPHDDVVACNKRTAPLTVVTDDDQLPLRRYYRWW